MPFTFHALVTAILLSRGFCLCTPVPSGEAGTAVRCSFFADDAGATEERAIELGELVDDVFTPWEDGGQATRIRGFQGSDMLLPVVRVPIAEGDPTTELCALVVLEATSDFGDPSVSRSWIFTRRGDHWMTGTIEMPLGGDRTTITTTVHGPGFTGALEPISLTLR
ncbi:MAG: hypothetical protein KF901_21305 [Myxococcales bacterium]|nr:hypothetical protein [Myxococcales bacterium]